MAFNNLPVNQGSGATPAGRNLLYLRDALEQAWYGIKAHFAAMSQEKGAGATDADFAQVAAVYGTLGNSSDGTNTANHTASGLFAETNSMIGTAAASVEQWLAKLKQ